MATTTHITTVPSDRVDELRQCAEHLAQIGAATALSMLEELVGTGLGVRSKSSATDPVTLIDTGVEELLRAELARTRSQDLILGEEGGGAGDPQPGQVRWIIDPVDGTVNLLYGIPMTAVSVAAEIDGVVVAGAVRNIIAGESWSAGFGRGASIRSAAGSVSPCHASGCESVPQALVGTGFSYDPAIRVEQGQVVARLLPEIRDIRRCGSAALDLCMVASGRLDAYYERCLKPWDHAAGALIAAEAGAIVSASDDDDVPTIAIAPGIAGQFLTLLTRIGGAPARS